MSNKNTYNNICNNTSNNQKIIIQKCRKITLNKQIKATVCPYCMHEYIYQYWANHHIYKCKEFNKY